MKGKFSVMRLQVFFFTFPNSRVLERIVDRMIVMPDVCGDK
jgi:hypothetical protein